MSTISNELSWSPSRAQLFQECPRAYYYRYYGSWGGWYKDADDETRLIYILKNIKPMVMWAGSIVHDTIKDFLIRYAATGEKPEVEKMQKEAVEVKMRSGWLEAIGKEWLDFPKKTNLFELYYGDGDNYGTLTKLPREVTEPVKERVNACLESFVYSPILKQMLSVPTADWKPVDQLDFFMLNVPGSDEEIKVWCAPDFAFTDENGQLVIIDWKTGNENPAGLRLQLGCYALFAMRKWNVELDRISLKGVFLRDGGRASNYQVDEQLVTSVSEQICASWNTMKSKLKSDGENQADIEDFPPTPSESKCTWCNFRRICQNLNS